MEKKYKELCIIELIIALIYLTGKLLVIKFYANFSIYFDLVFYIIVLLFFCVKYGIYRNKNYFNRISIRYLIILLLSYLLITYLLGCFTGFTKSIFDYSLIGILKNSIPIIIITLAMEFIRYIVANNSKVSKKPLIILTIAYILMTSLSSSMGYNLTNTYHIFNFICLTLLPTIAKQVLLSYITYHISCWPSLIYNIAFSLAPFVFPIFPDLGDYVNAILGILFPFIVYLVMKKIILYHEKTPAKVRGYLLKILSIPLLIFLITIILLIAGVFNYKLIAIGSDSMNPVYYRGDAVIYEKKAIKDIKKGDILVFENNHRVVTHRVTRIVYKGNQIYFQTKGDNNEKIDLDLVNQTNVLGTVKYIVKYIGSPTIWLNEKF